MEKLNDTFFYNLEKSVKTYRQYFQNQLKANGFDITLDQWLILNTIIENPNISQNEIAEKVFKDKASVARIIELLVQNGFLTRSIHISGSSIVCISSAVVMFVLIFVTLISQRYNEIH